MEVRAKASSFRGAFKAVEAAMDPLLHDWLQNPRNGKSIHPVTTTSSSLKLTFAAEADAQEFRQIRLACLPELLLTYNGILNHSAYFAGRDILKISMDLAALVAEEDSELATCVMQARRMPELLDSFAIVAKSMIHAEAKRPGEKTKDGKTLGLWSIRGQRRNPDEEEQ